MRVRARYYGDCASAVRSEERAVVPGLVTRPERRRSGAAAAAARASYAGMRSTPAVLVVDDDPDARGIFSEYLRAKGWVVFTAGDGRVAIEKAKDLGPDVIVMDLAMPRVDGFEAIRR